MDDDGPKEACSRHAEAFLDGVYADPAFEAARFERGMAVAWVVMSFIVREQISPASYLRWLVRMVKQSIVVFAAPQSAAMVEEEAERRGKTWH